MMKLAMPVRVTEGHFLFHVLEDATASKVKQVLIHIQIPQALHKTVKETVQWIAMELCLWLEVLDVTQTQPLQEDYFCLL